MTEVKFDYVGFPPPEGWVPPCSVDWPEPKNGIIDFSQNPQEIYRSYFWNIERKRILRISENILFALYPVVLIYWIIDQFIEGKLIEVYPITKPIFIGLFAIIFIINYANRLYFHLKYFTKFWNDDAEYPNPWFYVLRKKDDKYEFTDYRIGLFQYRKLIDANDIKLIVKNRSCKLKIKKRTYHFASYHIGLNDGEILAGLPWPSTSVEVEKDLSDWEDLDYSKNQYMFEWRIRYEDEMKKGKLFWPY